MLTNHFCKCDSCGATRRFAGRPFNEILAVIRRSGWRVTKRPGGWRHYCPDCAAAWKSRDKNEQSMTCTQDDRAPAQEWLPYRDD